jgi:uracil-DNA glycosylase family 4
MISGEGPIPSRVVLLGEYPGIEEVRTGRPFMGKAGRELGRYLNGYTLPHREDLYLSNWKKISPDKGAPVVLSDAEAEALSNELHATTPRLIVTLGHHVTRYFLGPDATLEAMHGIPHAATHWPYDDLPAPMIFPVYNPAAMLHSPNLQAAFAYDMRRLGLYLRGTLPAAPVDDLPGVYTLETSDDTPWLLPDWIAADTEGVPGKEWGLSYSTHDGYGGVVLAGEEAHAWADAVRGQRPEIVFHNALYDLEMFRGVAGLDLDAEGIVFHDTMIMAYLLGIEPQGLKPLAYRHAGMRQDDYADIVAAPNARIAEAWLYDLMAQLPQPVLVNVGKKKPKWEWQETDPVLGQARKLIEKMIAKGEPDTLRKRWSDGRAREILVEEQGFLNEFEGDPPEATLDDVPIETAVRYAGRDADATYRIFPPLRENIRVMGLDDVYAADLAIVPMVDRMQSVGITVNVPHLRAVSEMLAIESAINAETILAMTGSAINPNSGDQVAEYLYDVLEIHRHPGAATMRIKTTKSGSRLTTNDKVLEALSGLHPIIEVFQDGREIKKMKGTYADAIPRLVRQDGRLHPNYRLTRTDTGRLAATKPNILALPKHSTRGKLIREAFIPSPGLVFGEWDLDQIEMRMFAHDSNDPTLIAEFASGRDLHVATAALLFGIPYEVLYADYRAEKKSGVEGPADEKRFAAKAVNFGILMGITEYGLLDQFHKNGQLQWTLDMCAELLREWSRARKEAARYIMGKHAEARKYGYVRDWAGRVRWLEGVHSVDPYIQAEALRQAQATPTQSGAQAVMKRGMAMLWPMLKALRAEGVVVEALMQVHDALVLEYDPNEEKRIDEMVLFALCHAVQLRVPVTAKGKLQVPHLGVL